MQYSTRLLLCRLGLVVFCLLPTLLVAGWIVWRTSGTFGIARKAEWEQELANRLGLLAEIKNVSYPRPGVARLAEFVLLEPETKSPVARAGLVEVTAIKGGYAVEISQLVVEENQLGLLSRLVDSRFLQAPVAPRAQGSPLVLKVLPCDVALHEDGRYEALRQFSGGLSAADARAALDLDFQFANAPDEVKRARLSACRNRAEGAPQTVVEFETAGHYVPCSLLSEWWPELRRLGENSKFAGTFRSVDSGAEREGEWSGTLAQVDLDALVSERFPHTLSGTATMQIARALVQRGKLVELRGTLQAQNGSISASLVAAAEEHLALQGLSNLSQRPQGAAIPVRQLAIGFHLNGQMLALTGSADPTQAGVLLANAAGPILSAPPEHAVAAVNLLRALLPENQYQVPATRQTDALIGLLPLPDIVPDTSVRPASHTPARLSSAAAPAQSEVRQPVLR